MTSNPQHERESDYGPRASGWKPGDPDPNNAIVKELSESGTPGIAPQPKQILILGVVIVDEDSPLHWKMKDAGLTADE